MDEEQGGAAGWIRRHLAALVIGFVIGLFLIATPVILAGFLLFRRERAAMKRAEMASAMAQAARMQAETRVVEAETFLEKARQVSRVLRNAAMRLGNVRKDLDRCFRSAASAEEKRAVGERHRAELDAFGAALPQDTASVAAWLALKGWLRHLGGRTDEALVLFQASRKADPDVGLAWLFELMVYFPDLVPASVLPKVRFDDAGLTFENEKETAPGFEPALERITALSSGAKKSRIWGDSSSGDSRALLEAVEAWTSGDLNAAERGFTRALQVPEFAWLDRDILTARAKVRFLRAGFQAGIEDAERLVMDGPEWTEAWVLSGLLHHGHGVSVREAGGDPTDSFLKARACFDKALELDPANLAVCDLAAFREVR